MKRESDEIEQHAGDAKRFMTEGFYRTILFFSILSIVENLPQ